MDKIAQARAAGYSDAEIAAFLAKTDKRVADALAAGYQPSEVLSFIGQQATQRVTPPVQEQRDQERAQILQSEVQAAEARLQQAQQTKDAQAAARAQADMAAAQRELGRLPVAPPGGQPGGALRGIRADMPQVPPQAQPGVPRAIGVPEPPRAPQPEPSVWDRLIGELEAAGMLVTGATTGALSGANVAGRELAKQIIQGSFGTPEALKEVERALSQGFQAGTYMPRTQFGKEAADIIASGLQQLPAYVPIVGPAAVPAAAAVRQAPGVVREATTPPVPAPRIEPTLAPQMGPVARPAPTPVTPPQMAAGTPPVMPGGMAVQRGAAGAAGVPQAVERRVIAAQMPVPFTGETGLTKGQATRDFAQLQFEKESAKLGDLGEPLRERVQKQTANFIQNFDALIDLSQPISREKRDIGVLVDTALVNKAEVQRRKIRKAYDDARAAGQMQDPVELTPFATALTDLNRFEGVSANIPAIRKEAQRLGAISIDENGTLTPGTLSVDNAETLRQFVNEATDWTDRRQSLFAKKINASIDSATEGKGGELYRKARAERAKFAEEFENVGLTSKLLGTKRGTDERQVAFEDVFDKVVLLSPVDEMNKLRKTLITAGPDGRQAWSDLKAKGIDYIKQTALSPSQRDAAGNPLLSPDKLQRVVQSLDETGKLESLYGKKQAQTLRDLAELSTVIYTAPPGAINTSNTASALMVALDSLVTFGATGFPAPVVTGLREASKYVKNRKIKARIQDALKENQ
jgi:DNA-binding transcriptional MerR regulator